MMRVLERIARHPKAVVAAALGSIVAVGFLDHWTGPEISFSPFYLAPIALAAWCAGTRGGVLTAALAAGVWLIADLFPPHYSHHAIAFWNAAARLLMFLIVALLLSNLRRLAAGLAKTAAERALALTAERDGHQATRGALQQSELSFRTLIESVKDYAIFMLDPAGNIVTWNEGAERLTGHDRDIALGRHVSFLWPSEDAEHGRPQEALAKAAAEGSCQSEGLWVRRDGSRFWAMTVLTALRDARGRVQGFSQVVHDITDRRRLENEVLDAEERERRRIGRDLHDVLGQDLTGIAFLSKELDEDLQAQGRPEASDAARIVGLANQAVDRARSLARGLCPVELTAEGLMTALRQLASEISQVFGVRCDFDCARPVPIADEAVALHLYRIAQEATSNAIKHGRAKRITIRLGISDSHNVLEVIDDGCGIPEELPNGQGMGLPVMRYRAAAAGGSLSVRRLPRGGTAVTCTIPLGQWPDRSDHEHGE